MVVNGSLISILYAIFAHNKKKKLGFGQSHLAPKMPSTNTKYRSRSASRFDRVSFSGYTDRTGRFVARLDLLQRRDGLIDLP